MGWLDSNGLRRVWENIRAALAEKQDKLAGAAGQVVGFGADGKPVAQSTAGLVGPQGPQGPKGDTGATGAAGADGPQGDKGDPGLFYGTCSTASSTVAKVVTLSGFTLTAGAVVAVKFTNANTASSPTLNVNSTGAKYIKKYGSTAPDTYMWQAGAVVEFVYDGTYWIMLGGTTATTTYYGLTKLSSSVSSTSATEAATPSAVKQAYDLANAALPKSGGTMTGALSVLTPTGDAHAATKKYVDDMIAELADIATNKVKVACLSIPSPGNYGFIDIDVKLVSGITSMMEYTLSYSGTIQHSSKQYVRLAPPIGYAFTGLADTWLPALKIDTEYRIGKIEAYSGAITFDLVQSDIGKDFTFVSMNGKSSPARFKLEVL